MNTSRLCCDRAEELRPVHDSRLREAGSGERLCNALLWLTGIDSEAECVAEHLELARPVVQCEEAQASMPTRHGGSFWKNASTYRRFSWRRSTTLPSTSTQ